MTKNKLKRFAENKTFPHVVEPAFEEVAQGTFERKGRWKEFFGNSNPITIELGCGKGEYTVGLAELYPNRNFIGIDVKGARFWVGASYALKNKLSNVAFVRSRVDFIKGLFSTDEVSEIWITFPDPQNKKRNKRLTFPSFLNSYAEILTNGGSVNLKTDSAKLFFYTKAVAEHNQIPINQALNDIHKLESLAEVLKIETYYESLFTMRNEPIHFLSFELGKKHLEDAEFDELAFENAKAKAPTEHKVKVSKLTN